jgi:Ser/Thr protein kinase RdoA (MazF antagonist)
MHFVIQDVLTKFGLNSNTSTIKPFGSGLINTTWRVVAAEQQYILQKVNHEVFRRPMDIDDNIRSIANYLNEHHSDYLFVSPLPDLKGNTLVHHEAEGYFRIFNFVKNSHTVDVVNMPSQAFEAAVQFGKFTSILGAFPIDQLKTTIPDFHNLTLRHQQFTHALQNGNISRIAEAKDLITALSAHTDILNTFERIQKDSSFKKRVMHHDTKISNVLFTPDGVGICVIDLDTVMPGYFFSDLGDMMRTYLSPVNEESKNLDQIEIRDDFLAAIVKGYYTQMANSLSSSEKEHFFFAGRFMIYMQALRFLTDYLQEDKYYHITYPKQNLFRAENQVCLLRKFTEKENLLQEIMASL